MMAACGAMSLAYVVDSFTHHSYRPIKVTIVGACFLAMAVGAVLAADWYPSAPAAVYVGVLLRWVSTPSQLMAAIFA